MNKKRYAGLLWTKAEKYDKMDTKGLETVRRDNCLLVRKVNHPSDRRTPASNCTHSPVSTNIGHALALISIPGGGHLSEKNFNRPGCTGCNRILQTGDHLYCGRWVLYRLHSCTLEVRTSIFGWNALQVISELLQNKMDISLLVITKSLGKSADSEGYTAKQAHVELAMRMRKRDPGTAPNVGDRVPYVIIQVRQR